MSNANETQAPLADPEQLLPEGRHCEDCIHFLDCEEATQTPAGSCACEWSPSRFHLAVAL